MKRKNSNEMAMEKKGKKCIEIPKNLICKIFEFVSPEERFLNLSTVSKSWNEAVYSSISEWTFADIDVDVLLMIGYRY